MGRDVDFKKALENLINVSKLNDENELKKAILDAIWEASNYLELVFNYIILDKIGYHISFGYTVIRKGTLLYRIRDFIEGTDFSRESEWAPSPYKKQNRANKEGKEALYLASSEMLCFLETHKKTNEQYVLGKYECIEDITLGGFYGKEDFLNKEWLTADILNAFLIAPSRSEKNADLFEYLDKKIGHITPDDLASLKECIFDSKEEMKLPYKFAVLNQRDKYYNITNQLCEIAEHDYPYGIKYSSCYIPMGNPFIDCSEYNVALYSPALESIQFVGYETKTLNLKNKETFTDVNLAKILLGDGSDVKT